MQSNGLATARELLTRLIEIPSVNPFYDAESPGEAPVAEEVARRCTALGMTVRYDEVFPGRPNVEATLVAPQPRGTILFEVHTDTVGLPRDEVVPRVRSEGDRLYGRGACDVKGGLAAIIMALSDLSIDLENLQVNVILLGAADEENRFRGIVKYLESAPQIDGAVVIEPTRLRTVIGHGGTVRFTITVNGISAHSSNPEQGRSAIKDAYAVMDALDGWVKGHARTTPTPLIKPPVLSVNRIAGGHAFNIVPDRCTMDVDIRTLPTDDPQAIVDEISVLLSELADTGVSSYISDVALLGWGLDPDPTSMIAVSAAVASRGSGVDHPMEYVTFGTDASKVAQLGGIPAIVLGPGDIADAHVDDEFVDLNDVLKARDIYRGIITEFGSQLQARDAVH